MCVCVCAFTKEWYQYQFLYIVSVDADNIQYLNAGAAKQKIDSPAAQGRIKPSHMERSSNGNGFGATASVLLGKAGWDGSRLWS